MWLQGECTAEYNSCPFARYGNIMSVMGASAGPGKELDAHLRYYLYWLDKEDTVVIRKDGQYTLNPIADPLAPKRAAHVLLKRAGDGDGEGEGLWLEYRLPIGFDTALVNAEYVANTHGLIMATGASVIDGTTGAGSVGDNDYQQISFNNQWSDPYSGTCTGTRSSDDTNCTAVAGSTVASSCPVTDGCVFTSTFSITIDGTTTPDVSAGTPASITFTVSGMCQSASCVDSDGDGLLDAVEGTFDEDGDGLSNHLDLDR